MALRMVYEKSMGFMAKHYQRAVVSQLEQTGLRYEDLLNENEKSISEALELADPDIITGRTRRIKRAIDLSVKRKNLQDYAPGVQVDYFKADLYEDVKKIRARDQEFALLNVHNK
uniref:Uncharacterized protein n=1 Tax=Ditylum brightwellii TaxID=49249 RepID=A0A6V2QRF5_9STRA|mmetsp:Transcript_4164/g.5576  ORF Transcript_4164/g.5576 Transcript_4164/m.5576 type:complete len:115 (+) Transcript_4164:82-426(+)